jgi:hypothetical protein
MSGGDCRFAVSPNPDTGRIPVGFTDCGGWSGVGLLVPRVPHLSLWDSSPRNPLTLGVGVAQQGSSQRQRTRSYFLSTHSSQLQSDSVRIRWVSTGFDDCLVALGGQAVIVGLSGNRSVLNLIPTVSICCLSTSLAFTFQCGCITWIASQLTARIHGLKTVGLRLLI